jgi:hypothetical protein
MGLRFRILIRNPDPDPGRQKVSPKQEKKRNFMFNDTSFTGKDIFDFF